MKMICLHRLSDRLYGAMVQCDICGTTFMIFQGIDIATCPSCGFRECVMVNKIDNTIYNAMDNYNEEM